MPIIKCQECSNDVSTKAAACPNCGAKIKTPLNINGMMALIVICTAIGSLSICSSQSAPQPSQSAEEISKKRAADKRFHLASGLQATIKESLRDPDSLKFSKMLISRDASVACAAYRAKNGFDGTNKEIIVYTATGQNNTAKAWNKHCLRDDMEDLLFAVKK